MKSKEIRIISLLVLDTIFFLIEAIVGYSVHSLALVADSFHMLNDIISLFIALWAVKVKNTKPADGKYTYGWQRAEILGALVNAVFLLALCFTIVIEAIQRLISPPEISSPVLVLAVGFAGLASNLIGLVLFHEHGHSHSHSHSHSNEEEHDHEGHSHSHSDIGTSTPKANSSEFTPLLSNSNNASTGDLRQYMPENVVDNFDHQNHGKKKKSMNMEGVFLHVLGDALGNIGVIVAALIIWKTNWSWKYYSDPLISLIITVIIFSSALPLCKKSSKILLQASPTYIDTNEVVEAILTISNIKSVHDFHLWNLNEDILIASLHVELSEGLEDDNFEKLKFVNTVAKVREILHKFNIHSATIQPEFFNSNSNLASDQAYGETSKFNCSVDDATGCFNQNCLDN